MLHASNKKFCQNDDKKLLHVLENPYYYKIINDRAGKFYFRINSYGVDFATNKLKDFSAKKRFLTVFDRKFRINYVLDLNDRNYILEGAFSTKEGLMIPAPNGNKTLRFKLIKFI